MQAQVLQLTHQLKTQLKKLKESYPNIQEVELIYKQFKKLEEMIKHLSAKEATPTFFQALHDTTIDMRMKLLQDLAKSESLRRQIEIQCNEALCEAAVKIQQRDERIQELEDKLRHAQNNGKLDVVNSVQIMDLKKQISKLKEINNDLIRKLGKKLEVQKKQSKKAKQEEAHRPNYQNSLSPSLDPVTDSREAKTIYENILGSFSELPNERNLTEWEHTYSQQETQRKAKSVSSPHSPYKVPDELWRLIYIQALSIEEFINQRL